MVLRAVEAAATTREWLGCSGVATHHDLRRLLDEADLTLWLGVVLAGRVWGLLYRKQIVVRAGLSPGAQLAVIAHEYGHHALGHDRLTDDAIAYGRRLGAPREPVWEALAQVYAWTLLLGRPARDGAGVDRQLHAGQAAGLPVDFLFTGASILLERHPAVRAYPLLG